MDSPRNLARQRAHRARVWRYANAVAHGLRWPHWSGLQRTTRGGAHDACAAGLQGRCLYGGAGDGACHAGCVCRQKAVRKQQAQGLIRALVWHQLSQKPGQPSQSKQLQACQFHGASDEAEQRPTRIDTAKQECGCDQVKHKMIEAEHEGIV